MNCQTGLIIKGKRCVTEQAGRQWFGGIHAMKVENDLVMSNIIMTACLPTLEPGTDSC